MLMQKATSSPALEIKVIKPILSERIWWHAVSTTAETTLCERRRMAVVTRSKPSVDSLSFLILSFARIHPCACAPARASSPLPLLRFRRTPQSPTIWSRPGTADLESDPRLSPPARTRNAARLRSPIHRQHRKTSKTYCLQVSPCE